MTEVEFSRKLSALSEAAQQLNVESDSINTLLADFEKRIAETNVGIEAGVPLWGAGDLEDRVLWWKKGLADRTSPFKTRWCFVVELNGGAETPLLESSREVRAAALDAIPRLVDRLTNEATDRSQKIKNAKSLLQ